MLTLFNQYKDSGEISQALLIGRNLVNRDPSDKDAFDAYFDYLCLLAKSLPSLEDRQTFAGQASVALAFFSENAALDSDLLSEINTYQQRLADILEEINITESIEVEAAQKHMETTNGAHLKSLFRLKDMLYSCTNQEDFDKTLSEISVVDSKIDKDALTTEQNRVYEGLTKDHTELISSKMRELEHKKNKEYNKQAVEAYAKAFKLFRGDEAKYRGQNQLFGLVSSTLFAYDASRLFNETLIYYNHIYSYIFSKLDDDGKLALTRFSVECERKLR